MGKKIVLGIKLYYGMEYCNIASSWGCWRKLRTGDINDLQLPPNIVRAIKTRINIWAGHVARKGVEKKCI